MRARIALAVLFGLLTACAHIDPPREGMGPPEIPKVVIFRYRF